MPHVHAQSDEAEGVEVRRSCVPEGVSGPSCSCPLTALCRAQLLSKAAEAETRVYLPDEGGTSTPKAGGRDSTTPPLSATAGLRALLLGSKLNVLLAAIPFAMLSQCVTAASLRAALLGCRALARAHNPSPMCSAARWSPADTRTRSQPCFPLRSCPAQWAVE